MSENTKDELGVANVMEVEEYKIRDVSPKRYIRYVFGVYRVNGPASFEDFYLLHFYYKDFSIKNLEAMVIAALNTNEPDIINTAMSAVKFPGYDIVPEDETDPNWPVSWRILSL